MNITTITVWKNNFKGARKLNLSSMVPNTSIEVAQKSKAMKLTEKVWKKSMMSEGLQEQSTFHQ